MNNEWKILCGDAVDKLKTLPDNSINTCITSPPYYALRDYGVDGQIGLENTPEDYINKLVDVFHEVKRVLKDDGTLWVNIGDSYASNSHSNHNFNYDTGRKANNSDIGKTKTIGSGSIKQKDLVGVPWMLAFALRADGWYLRQDIIWEKPNPMPESVTDRCTKSHEYIFLLSKSPNYYFDNVAIQEDAVSDDTRLPGVVRNRLFNYDSKINNNPEAYLQKESQPHSSDYKYVTGIKFGGNKYGDSNDPHFQTYSGNEYVYTGKRNKRDVWRVGVSSYKGAHFATYPEELITPCILAGCPENGTVLDCFNGSATTGAAALKNGRNYIGIELNPDYVKVSEERLKEVSLECNKQNFWWG